MAMVGFVVESSLRVFLRAQQQQGLQMSHTLQSSQPLKTWQFCGLDVFTVHIGFWMSCGLQLCWLGFKAALLVKAIDMLLDVARNCLIQARLRLHPTEGPFWFRPLAASEANLIKTYSELGRMAGHYQRGGMWGVIKHFGHRFDWFLGVEAKIVRQEKKKARVCFAAYMLAIVGLVLAETSLPGQYKILVGLG